MSNETYSKPELPYHNLTPSTDLMDTQTLIQNRFIAKVYILLLIQLFTTALFSVVAVNNHVLQTWMISHPSFIYLAFLVNIVSLLLSFCYGQRHPFNLIILGIFTISESYLVSFICLHYTTKNLILAASTTSLVFLGLTVYALYTKNDFNYLGGFLWSSLIIWMVGLTIQTLCFGREHFLSATLALFGATISVGYILYDTSQLINRLSPDDYVYASLTLYTDIIMLFTRILEILDMFGDN